MTRLRRVVQIPVYWIVVGIATSVVSPVLATVASVRIAENGAARARTAQQASQQAGAEHARTQACTLFGSLLDAYDETPPLTPAGKNVQQAYRDYYNQILHCTPARK